MKKQSAKWLSVSLATALLLAGCGSSGENSNQVSSTAESKPAEESQTTNSEYPAYLNLDSEFPIVKEGEKVTLKIATVYNSTLGGDTEDIWFWKWCKEKMNLDFEVEQIMDSAAVEKKNLMLASGNLADLNFNLGLTTSDLVTYGQIEKKLFDVNSMISPELTPNLAALFDEFADLKASISCPDGGIYSFPKINLVNDPASLYALFINTDWLDQLQMEKPKTLEEFYEVLKAFQTLELSDGKEVVPLSGNFETYDPTPFILSAMGFVTRDSSVEPALRDQKVEIPCGSELYEDYLRFMNRLYTEGLIDENFFTLDNTQLNAQIAEQRVGVIVRQAPYLYIADNFQAYEALTPVTSEYNDTPIAADGNPYVVGTIVMAADTEYPEVAMRFVDYIFSQKGGVYCWQGAPAVAEEDTLGMYQGWTVEEETNNVIYPDVVSGEYESEYDIIQRILSPFSGTIGNRSDILNDKRIVGGLEALPETVYNLDNGEHFYRHTVTENVMPYTQTPYPNNVYFTEEENLALTDLKTVISDFVEKETAKFITGVNSLDNIDRYYQDLASLDFEEYQNYYVHAYENYLQNK